MILGLLSDAHGNAAAVHEAIGRLSSRVDHLLFAGDAFSDHRFCNATVGALRDAGADYVLGNHELSLLGLTGARVRSAPHVDRKLLAYVAERPTSLRLRIGGCRILMTHGSPIGSPDRYVVPPSPLLDQADELDADVVVLGHAHIPFTYRCGPTLVVNPGSVGRTDDPSAGDTVTCATFDTTSGDVELVRFANPATSRSRR